MLEKTKKQNAVALCLQPKPGWRFCLGCEVGVVVSGTDCLPNTTRHCYKQTRPAGTYVPFFSPKGGKQHTRLLLRYSGKQNTSRASARTVAFAPYTRSYAPRSISRTDMICQPSSRRPSEIRIRKRKKMLAYLRLVFLSAPIRHARSVEPPEGREYREQCGTASSVNSASWPVAVCTNGRTHAWI